MMLFLASPARRMVMTALVSIVLVAATPVCGAPAVARTDDDGLFEPIRSVLQHPRCQNCHVADGIPRQYDDSRPHAQNVQGGADGGGVVGLPCSSCHGTTNAPAAAGPNAPPGAPGWHLAPKEMVWVGATSRDICLRLRDPKTNGGKDFDALLHHFSDDPLVAWGWNPGGNRGTPPLSQQETAAAVRAWIEAGAPCPAQ